VLVLHGGYGNLSRIKLYPPFKAFWAEDELSPCLREISSYVTHIMFRVQMVSIIVKILELCPNVETLPSGLLVDKPGKWLTPSAIVLFLGYPWIWVCSVYHLAYPQMRKLSMHHLWLNQSTWGYSTLFTMSRTSWSSPMVLLGSASVITSLGCPSSPMWPSECTNPGMSYNQYFLHVLI